MSSPFDIDMIRDIILEYVGWKHFPIVRQVNYTWNKTALTLAHTNNKWRVRITPENVDEYISSSLLRVGGSTAKSKLKVALDFGPAITQESFHHFIDVVSNKLCVQDGPNCVEKITFHGAAASFELTPADWMSLITLLQLVSPGLRVLDLFDQDWRVPEETFLPRDYYAGNLTFPHLKELAYSWQEPTKQFLDTLLEPGVIADLSKFKLISPRPGSISMTTTCYLMGQIRKLAQHPHLTNAMLGLDFRVWHYFQHRHGLELRTVRSLVLQFENEMNGPGCFISRVFPELRDLDLQCDHDERETLYLGRTGTLTCLESLAYGRKGGAGRLQVNGSEFMQDISARLQSVRTDFGFELINVEDEASRQPIKFPGVWRLELRIPATNVAAGYKQLCTNLQEMYPNVTCLAIELEEAGGGGRGTRELAHSVEIARQLILKFGACEELAIVGKEADKFLDELMEVSHDLKTVLGLVRRLKLKGFSTLQPPRRHSRRTLFKILANFSKLEFIEIDHRFLSTVQSEKKMSIDIYSLRHQHPGLEITFT